MRFWVSGSTNALPVTRFLRVAPVLSYLFLTQRGFHPQRGNRYVYVFKNLCRTGLGGGRRIFDDSDICRQSGQRVRCGMLLWQGL